MTNLAESDDDLKGYPRAVSEVEGPEALERLQELAASDNVAELLDREELGRIGTQVIEEYEVDKSSRSEWEESYKKAMDMALQKSESKSYPWRGAANVKYPLLTSASMQFAARALPAIIPDSQPVKAKIQGKDEDGKKAARGERVAEHMSWQLTEEMSEWEEDTDKLLTVLPIAGLCFRKTYYSPTLGRNKSELVMPDKLVVNDGARDLETCPRITHELDPIYPNTFEERVRQGIWRKIDLGLSQSGDEADEQAPHDFLEQHRLIDLDEDGYAEPWIVTVHKDTAEVVRIVANFEERDIKLNMKGDIAKITRANVFTKYSFLPNPSGAFHDIGFGFLLGNISESIDTTLNLMLDAGHVANVGGGFMGSGARMRSGQYRFRPGEYKPVDVPGKTLRENIVSLTFPGPSAVLFNLLGLLVDAAKDITNVKDVMTGEAQGKNQSPTTTLALIEQGMQVFSAIYKRVYRSLKQEYKKLYRLNSIYLEDDNYFNFHDSQKAIKKKDYAEGDLDIVPVADPKVVTNMQRMGRAQFLMQFDGHPRYDSKKLHERLHAAAGTEDMDEVILDEATPDPQVLAQADEMDMRKKDFELKRADLADQMDVRKRELELKELETRAKLAQIEFEMDQAADEQDASQQQDVVAEAKAEAISDETARKRSALKEQIKMDREKLEADIALGKEKAAAELEIKRKVASETAKMKTEAATRGASEKKERDVKPQQAPNVTVQMPSAKRKVKVKRDAQGRMSELDIDEG